MKRRGKFFGFKHLKSPTHIVVKTFTDRIENVERHSYIREHCRRGNWSAIYSYSVGTTSWSAMGTSFNMGHITQNLAPGLYDIYAFDDADDAVFFKLRFA